MEEGSLSPARLVQGLAMATSHAHGQAAQVRVWAAGFHREGAVDATENELLPKDNLPQTRAS